MHLMSILLADVEKYLYKDQYLYSVTLTIVSVLLCIVEHLFYHVEYAQRQRNDKIYRIYYR